MKRAFALCALLVGGVFGRAPGARAVSCSEFVSTGLVDGPAVGALIGVRDVVFRFCFEVEGAVFCFEEVHEVGIYDFDGAMIAIDCTGYTYFA